MAEDNTKDAESIGDVVDGLDELADEVDEEVCFGDVLEKFGSRSFAPVMMVLALTELSPIGAIPSVPTLLALGILLIASQMLFGREHIWVPGWIEKRSVSKGKMHKATDKMDGIANWLDSWSGSRLEVLTKGPAIQAAALLIMILCVFVAPLEVLPWASAGPMLAISIICLALIVRDGLVMLIAWLIALGAISGAVYYAISSGLSLADFNPL